MNVKVKICGITNIQDAISAIEAGADALGFIFVPESKRYVDKDVVREITKHIPPFIVTVGVFVDEPIDKVKTIVEYCNIDIVQLHGNETPEYCHNLGYRIIKSFRVKKDEDYIQNISGYDVSGYLLDTYVEDVKGGTGKSFEWHLAIKAKKYGPVILAGGLTPENVDKAIDIVKPYGVDVSSGVEKIPGKKDKIKMKEFVQKVRELQRR
jgi:phosphoribosylanthranilate isomerase